MQINDTSGAGQGLYQDALYEVSAVPSNYQLPDFMRNANFGLDIAIALIIAADTNWNFDDTNATDLPIGTTDLVAFQQDYSFDVRYLTLNQPIIITNPDGITLTTLTPVNPEDMPLVSGFGVPTQYAKIGESIFLDPIPNYSILAATSINGLGGLKAYFTRQISYFTASDTSKEPGFAKHLHKFISLYAASVYAATKGLAVAANLAQRLLYYTGNEDQGGTAVGEFKRFYGRRTADVKSAMKPMYENNR